MYCSHCGRRKREEVVPRPLEPEKEWQVESRELDYCATCCPLI